MNLRKGKPAKSARLSVIWVSFTLLDIHLHKTALLQILEKLSDMGHSPSLIAVRSRNPVSLRNQQIKLTCIPLRYIPFISPVIFDIILIIILPLLIVTRMPDFVVFEPDISVLGSIPGFLISKIKKVKFVMDIRTTPVEVEGFRGFSKKTWFSLSIIIAKKLFSGITIITPLMKKEIVSNYRLNPNKVGVWTSGVSEVLFDPEKSHFLGSNKLKEKFIIMYHGIFTATRGLDETIEAIKILKPKYPQIVLFLLGSGPFVSVMKDKVRKEGLEENVFIHEPVEQSEVPKFIQVCDVGIIPLPNHPYWRHQSPLKLLEYLAMEKVVILTDIPAHRFVIKESKCGIYIESINPKEIAYAIEKAYENKEKLEEWGKIGREIVKEKYTWDKVASSLEGYLLSINQIGN